MKRSLILLAVLAAAGACTGCAGLSVNFDVGVTYRSAVPAGGRSDTPPTVTIVPLPAPITPGKAS